MVQQTSRWGDSVSKEIWEQVVANSKLLDSCTMHDFVDMNPENIVGKKWKCKNCNGTADTLAKHWYEQGLEHGNNMAKGN